ncbi:FtsQ-type POTRA domain-containing protein, partial [Candidatus Parcubacteria bacterium]|nr:FtsQ-type POTRA domain-containing protein [Candidatus Parcubacteria bacterium]
RQTKFTLYASLAVLILISPFIILRSQRLLISNIHVVGNDVTKTEDIEEVVSKDLSGSFFHLIPHSSTIFYPRNKMMRDLTGSLPRVRTAAVSLEDFHTMLVEVTERAPAALYCQNTSSATNPKGCFFIDTTGYIFGEAPAFSGGVYSIYTSEPVLDDPLKKVLLLPEVFKGLEEFLKSLANIPLYPEVLTLKDDEYDLALSSGTHVLWKKGQDLETIYSNLDSFILNPTVRKLGISNLLYIDLRFENKVFYKFRGE